MSRTIRFRPIVFGPLEDPDFAFFLGENPDGKVYLREMETAVFLRTTLEETTLEDLPEQYRIEGVTILPVQEVSGSSPGDAYNRLFDVMYAVSHGAGVRMLASASR